MYYASRIIQPRQYSCNVIATWWRGSVGRTSVFDWQTFPDLRLIYGWHVTTSSGKCPLQVSQSTN